MKDCIYLDKIAKLNVYCCTVFLDWKEGGAEDLVYRCKDENCMCEMYCKENKTRAGGV